MLQEPYEVDPESRITQFATERSNINHALDPDWNCFLAKPFPAWSEFQEDSALVDQLIKCSQLRMNGWAMTS
jgi:hypothetical protein